MDFKEINNLVVRVKINYRDLEIARMGREWNVSELTEGFVGDVGDLMKLVMAKEGKRVIENTDEKLKEELCDCLWAIINISNKLNINLEKEFVVKMEKLEERVNNSLNNPAIPD